MVKNILFPDEEIYDGKYFNIHQDRETPIPAFFILESKRGIRSFAEFTDYESEEFMLLLKKMRKGMREELNINDVYFFKTKTHPIFFIYGYFQDINGWKNLAGKSSQ